MKQRELMYLKYKRDQEQMNRIGVVYSRHRIPVIRDKYFNKPSKQKREYNYSKRGKITTVGSMMFDVNGKVCGVWMRPPTHLNK